jgi:hypothetical protein
MFAGLPGIGVGTLFYVLLAFAMPFTELIQLVRGQSSVARWVRIAVQLFHSICIVLSIMVAERVLMFMLGQAGPESLHPARLLNRELAGRAPQSILAAPIIASLLILGGVLLTVEVLRMISVVRGRRTREVTVGGEVFPNDALPPADSQSV